MSTVRAPSTVLRVGGVDIGGTKIAVGLEDDIRGLVARAEFPTQEERKFDRAMERIVELLSKALKETGSELTGIGVGCTGPVDPFSGTLGNVSFFPWWEGCNPVSALSNAFGVPVVMENDADAAALAEMRRGAGRGKNRLICVTVGTGIGAGIILDGRLYRGADGFHPELGHHVVEASGGRCLCGARGCWESLASGPALSEWFKQNAPKGYASADITAEEICAGARRRDPWCLRAVCHGAFYLGVGIANLINAFVPEAIVLGGSVMKSADLFLDKIRSVVRENCRLVPSDRTAIVLASLGTDVGLIGAAEVWRHRLECKGT